LIEWWGLLNSRVRNGVVSLVIRFYGNSIARAAVEDMPQARSTRGVGPLSLSRISASLLIDFCPLLRKYAIE
jgi:hypothetical protein